MGRFLKPRGKKNMWENPPWLWRWGKRVATGLGTFVLTLLVLSWVARAIVLVYTPDLQGQNVLLLNLSKDYPEHGDSDPLVALVEQEQLTLLDLIETLHAAARDDKIVGILARVDSTTMGLARLKEIREAILAFKRSGKFAYVYADTFGEGTGGLGAYYLASAFDKIILQPSGELAITAPVIESPFLRGFFDKYGVQPQFAARHEYKSAGNIFTNTGFSAADKENLGALLDDIKKIITDEIGASRGLPATAIANFIDAAPLSASDAKAKGLIDAIGYFNEALCACGLESGERSLLKMSDYLALLEPIDAEKTIALIYADGEIMRGSAGANIWQQSSTVMSHDFSKLLAEIAEDKSISAVVLRINSPGGSATASDTIWQAIKQLRETGKPVVVSMGDVAASGGYYMAVAANYIVAQPTTITGSIGVFGGKFVFKDAAERFGITFDSIARGESAGMFSSARPFTPQEWERFNASLDNVYQDFTAKVASARKLTPAEIDAVARGRVWSGQSALANKLVDALGGLDTAITAAKGIAEIPEDEPVKLLVFPRKPTPAEIIGMALSGEGISLQHLMQIMARHFIVGLQETLTSLTPTGVQAHSHIMVKP